MLRCHLKTASCIRAPGVSTPTLRHAILETLHAYNGDVVSFFIKEARFIHEAFKSLLANLMAVKFNPVTWDGFLCIRNARN